MMTFLRDRSEDPRAEEQLLRLELDALSASDAEAASGAADRARLLGRIAERCRLLGQHEAAVLHARRALEEAQQARVPALLPQSVIRLAIALRYAGRTREAVELFEHVVALGDRPGSERFLHYALQHMGWCLTELGEHERAQECLTEALRIREQMGDDTLVAATRQAIMQLEPAR